MIICVTDPPPATAKLLTDQLVKERIEKYLNEEKYTQTLKLVVEVVGQCDLDLGSTHYILSRHRSATDS